MTAGTIDVGCPFCRRVSRLGSAFRGEGRCPGCRRRVEVKDGPTPDAPPIAVPLDPFPAAGHAPAAWGPEPQRPPALEGLEAPPSVDNSLVGLQSAAAALAPVLIDETPGDGLRRASEVDGNAGPAGDPTLRPCPRCGEAIKRAAKKCRHCQRFIDPAPAIDAAPAPASQGPPPAPGPGERPCPRCARPILAAAKKCKHCLAFVDGAPVDLEALRVCPRCGETIRAAAKKCRHCGEFLDPSVQRGRRQADTQFEHAPPATRLLAYVIDSWLLNAPAAALFFVGVYLIDSRRTEAWGIACWVLAGILFFGLCGVQWYRLVTRGATLAKGWLGLVVLRADGTPVDFVHGVVLRNWIMDVLGNLYIFGCMFRLVDGLMVFGQDRRTLHDHMAGTIVVEARSVVRADRTS